MMLSYECFKFYYDEFINDWQRCLLMPDQKSVNLSRPSIGRTVFSLENEADQLHLLNLLGSREWLSYFLVPRGVCQLLINPYYCFNRLVEKNLFNGDFDDHSNHYKHRFYINTYNIFLLMQVFPFMQTDRVKKEFIVTFNKIIERTGNSVFYEPFPVFNNIKFAIKSIVREMLYPSIEAFFSLLILYLLRELSDEYEQKTVLEKGLLVFIILVCVVVVLVLNEITKRPQARMKEERTTVITQFALLGQPLKWFLPEDSAEAKNIVKQLLPSVSYQELVTIAATICEPDARQNFIGMFKSAFGFLHPALFQSDN